MTERRAVTLLVEGVRCSATLALPSERGGPVPCVVMAHGTTGTQDFALPPYVDRFTGAGLGVLTFDYRHFGASEGDPRQLIRVSEQVQDLRAAVELARTIPDIDPDRIALWGTSLGAGHAVSIAADDPRIAAVVGQLAFLGIDTRHDSPRTAKVTFTLFARALRDAIGARLGRPPVMMPMLGRPGDVAVFAGDEDYEAMRPLEAAAPTWRNEMAARSLFSLMRYRPVKAAARVRAPVLFLVVEDDTATSTQLTEQAAQDAPHAEVRRYPGTHFSAYRGPVFEQMVTDEVEFLCTQFATVPRPPR